MKKLFLFITVVLFLASCGGGSGNNKASQSESEHESMEGNSIDQGVMEAGANLYRAHCLACHQTDGSGNPGMYPPLRQTEFILGEKDTLIKIVLNGLQGPLEVLGEEYNSVMAPYNFLTDREISDLLTYVRNSFGNNADAVSPSEVAAARN